MTKLFYNIKLKNYLYEIIEYVSAYILGLGIWISSSLVYGLFNKNFTFYYSPFSKLYDNFLLEFKLLQYPDSARIDLTLLNITLILFIIDFFLISLTSKSIFDHIFKNDYLNNMTNLNHKIKLISYACFKYISILLFIMSSKVNEPFFVFYNHYFYLYFIINLIIRIITKGQKSLLFFVLGLKNI